MSASGISPAREQQCRRPRAEFPTAPRATLQIGIGAVPDAVAGLLAQRRDLGIHSEFFADGLRQLITRT